MPTTTILISDMARELYQRLDETERAEYEPWRIEAIITFWCEKNADPILNYRADTLIPSEYADKILATIRKDIATDRAEATQEAEQSWAAALRRHQGCGDVTGPQFSQYEDGDHCQECHIVFPCDYVPAEDPVYQAIRKS